MAYRFFLIPARDAVEAASELNAFLGNHRVLAVARRWVDQGADSYWAFCVDYYDSSAGMSEKPRGARTRGKDYREILSPDDFARFAQLRDRRKEVAQAEGVPVYNWNNSSTNCRTASMSFAALIHVALCYTSVAKKSSITASRSRSRNSVQAIGSSWNSMPLRQAT